MKKWSVFLIVSLFVCVQSVVAKTTYIPNYDNKIIVIDGGKIDSVISYHRVLDYTTGDGLISCSIVQQVVTPDLVKDIKRMKRAAGWATTAAVLGAASSGISAAQMSTGRVKGYDVINYVDSRETTKQSLNMSADATAKAEELMDLMIDLVVRNNSDKEILVNDMTTGQNWFVLPQSFTYISIRKDENVSLRISPVAHLDENVRYFHIVSTSQVKKYELSHETDTHWYIPNQYSARKNFHCQDGAKEGYIRIDKETMQGSVINETEFKAIKNAR